MNKGRLAWAGGAPKHSPYSYNCNVTNNIVIAAVRSQGSIVKGQLASKTTKILMDSGSSISLVRESIVRYLLCDKTRALDQGIRRWGTYSSDRKSYSFYSSGEN